MFRFIPSVERLITKMVREEIEKERSEEEKAFLEDIKIVKY